MKFFITLSAILIINSCSQKETNILEYFNHLEFTKVDTLITDSSDSSIVFYFHSNPSEKIYVHKDKVQHVFGHLDENGTFWAKEWLVYTKNGEIIDTESQYVAVNLNKDITKFELIGADDLEFKIRVHQIPNDSISSQTFIDIKAENKILKIPSKELIGNGISIVYQTVIRNDSIEKIIENEVFISRETKINSLKHLNLINDKRIKTIANTPQ
ncbi:hypothetical protein [Carboxylicivirga taeanensis]|uniref:hypothetical protein n=1 Tax=Carboxylicivirga taeanensis TaxID=1416875 RepID=UPI003F6E1B4F